MSRHRNVRNLVEDDYYDGYDDDDYYDDDYYEEGEEYNAYKPPPPKTAPPPTITSTKTATTKKPYVAKAPPPTGFGHQSSISPGINKPPSGWGKPETNQDNGSVTKPSSRPAAASPLPGIVKPPPGWGKPGLDSKTSSSLKQQRSVTTKSRSKSPKRGVGGDASTYKPKPVPAFVQSQKSQLSMVILGHVDAGKSTLMGQVLISTGEVTKRDAAKQTKLSWLLDENESERARGVTMEIGTKTIRVPKHDIVVLDAPGHHDFIPVMITGAANADVAILVVAAVTGEFEAGFSGGGQTKEHIQLARGLGVTQIIVAINKLDVEGWKKGRYDEIQSGIKDFLLKQEFKEKRMQFVPISGLTGDNIKVCNNVELTKWYKGPTLLEAVNNLFPVNRKIEKPLRFIVTDVFSEGKGIVTRGRVIQGFIEVGDQLVVLPVGDVVRVSKLEHLQAPSDNINDPRRLGIGIAGDTVQIIISDIDIMRISIGNILCFPNAKPPLVKKALARIAVMDKLNVPIIRGAQAIFHMHSLDIPVVLTKLVAILKRDGSVKKERPRALTSGVNASIEFTLSERVAMEEFSDCRALGRFVLRRGGETVAIGLIDETL